MTNTRKVLETIFVNNDFQEIIYKYNQLKENNSDDFFDILNLNPVIVNNDEFLKFFSNRNPNLYNKDEVRNLYSKLKDEWTLDENTKKTSIFNILSYATKDMLMETTNDLCCKYTELLRWRELSYTLGEDILTTSYLAKNDLYQGGDRNFFGWKSIIGNDNKRLKEILKRGISENHFHLKGSSPHCELNWVCLMNNIISSREALKEFDNVKSLVPNISINNFYSKNNENIFIKFSDYIKVAFLIRGYLFLQNENLLKDAFNEDKKFDKNKIVNPKLDFIFDDLINQMDDILQVEKHFFSKIIDGKIIDYAIPKTLYKENFNDNIFLCGERIFLYNTFSKIYKDDMKEDDQILFYLYLLIKQKFRSEFVQINKEVGFGNFSDYQDRKSMFLNKMYKNAVSCMAIKSSTPYEYFHRLEARIAPISQIKDIKFSDKNVENRNIYGILDEYSLRKIETDKKYFYAIHLIKTPEKFEEKNLDPINPRHYKLRDSLVKNGNRIIELKERYKIFRNRVKGIDAANVEIGCRPEILATVFRKIKSKDIENKFTPFGITYHVGEEFLDIIDGLRAIDECILFLNFENGHRIGHGLALGVIPEDYYKSKGNILVLPQQDLLDNIVWMYYKIQEYNINVSSSFLMFLKSNFEKYYSDIYENENNSIELYYNAWKLRGDEPDDSDNYRNNIENPFEKYKRNYNPKVVESRKNKKVRDLYIEYNYNPTVKQNGQQIVEFHIIPEYIKATRELQNKMQETISRKGIFIETNPSSNVLISTFNRYAEHPIKRFYNLGLTHDHEELDQCPQLCVSINTDDQGVFGTSLENEYALLALALEKEKKEDGTLKYKPTMIYEWLDKIRQMGIEQSFYNNDEEDEEKDSEE